MGSLFQPRLRLLAGLCAILLFPALSWAVNPVDQLRDALKLDVGGFKLDEILFAKRNDMIDKAIPKLKSISQLRQAVFLKEWSQQSSRIELNKQKIIEYRKVIGDRFSAAIRAAANEANPDKHLAIAILIAEIAESDQQIERDEKEKLLRDPTKFARNLTDVVKKLATETNLPIRQAALNALGKITADPGVAIPILKGILEKDELGPRRLAAYALSDIVKNTRYHKRDEALGAIDGVVSTAAVGLKDTDELIRGYCLQALQLSAKAFIENFSSAEVVDGKLNKEIREILLTYQSANPPLLKALNDSKFNVRWTALQALDQIYIARSKIIQALQEIAPEKRDGLGALLKSFDAPDPLGPIIAKDAMAIARLLQKDQDVRLRRGAIEFLELLGEQAESASQEIAAALRDSDRFVRWSAARAIRNLPPRKVSGEAIKALGKMLNDADPELTKAAAEAIEALGSVADDAIDVELGFAITNGDAEGRIITMRALVSIGGNSAQLAIPKLVTALTDSEVRVRRSAANTIGQLVRPGDPEVVRKLIAGLKNALRDDDSEVRLSASEAILNLAEMRKLR